MNSESPRKQSGRLPPVLDTVVVTRVRDLVDGFKVRHVLPSARRRMVGPFIFLDQMGPEILSAGRGLDVATHPHIGLATVTYLFTGELLHRDILYAMWRDGTEFDPLAIKHSVAEAPAAAAWQGLAHNGLHSAG
jgi:hypothetical protein